MLTYPDRLRNAFSVRAAGMARSKGQHELEEARLGPVHLRPALV